jgi:hypothetical protein
MKARFADEDAADRALGHGLGISGCGYRASLEGDRVCAAMERAITNSLPVGGGTNVVAASDISLRLASGQPLQCFLPLMRRHLARPSEPNTPFLRSLAALARPSPD